MICGLIRKATRKIVRLKPPESLQAKYTTCSCDINFRFSFSTPRRLRSTSLRMIRSQSSIGVGGGGDASRGGEDNNKIMKKSTPVHDKLQQFLNVDPIGGWEESWKEGVTPWDLGQPTPVLLHLHNTGALPFGTALIPGCGTGHDVVAIACPQRHVVGLDISESAINKAIQLFSSSPNADYLTFITADFFNWQPTELFDVIFDYTFFCALEPDMRPAWARRIQDLLKPDGELITLMFPISDHDGGPPYKVSVADYNEVLNPIGIKATSIVDNELAVGPRRGREKLGRWKRSKGRSLL